MVQNNYVNFAYFSSLLNSKFIANEIIKICDKSLKNSSKVEKKKITIYIDCNSKSIET